MKRSAAGVLNEHDAICGHCRAEPGVFVTCRGDHDYEIWAVQLEEREEEKKTTCTQEALRKAVIPQLFDR